LAIELTSMHTLTNIAQTLETRRFDLTTAELSALLETLLTIDAAARVPCLSLHYECLEACFDALHGRFAFDSLPQAVALRVFELVRRDLLAGDDISTRVAMATCVRMASRLVPGRDGDRLDETLAWLIAAH
jgi:hypothetical protein